tara:strand:- start:18 stop:323 length:306 start_codon:yes stop_codon:yes gene_type:complete
MIGKYEFNSREQAKFKIDRLSDSNHSVVELGFLTLKHAVYDGEELMSEAVVSSKYSVDILWNELTEHPYGWKSYSIDLDSGGSHSFYGVDYLVNKIASSEL